LNFKIKDQITSNNKKVEKIAIISIGYGSTGVFLSVLVLIRILIIFKLIVICFFKKKTWAKEHHRKFLVAKSGFP